MVINIISLLLVVLLAAADQGLKLWATASLKPITSAALLPGIVELRYILNRGAAFSILQGKQLLLILFTGACLAGMVWYLVFRCGKDWLLRSALILVLGGGLGNLIDRVLAGEVVDYICLLFIDFPVFNFADICVCVGVGLLILSLLLAEPEQKEKKEL